MTVSKKFILTRKLLKQIRFSLKVKKYEQTKPRGSQIKYMPFDKKKGGGGVLMSTIIVDRNS